MYRYRMLRDLARHGSFGMFIIYVTYLSASLLFKGHPLNVSMFFKYEVSTKVQTGIFSYQVSL